LVQVLLDLQVEQVLRLHVKVSRHDFLVVVEQSSQQVTTFLIFLVMLVNALEQADELCPRPFHG